MQSEYDYYCGMRARYGMFPPSSITLSYHSMSCTCSNCLLNDFIPYSYSMKTYNLVLAA